MDFVQVYALSNRLPRLDAREAGGRKLDAESRSGDDPQSYG